MKSAKILLMLFLLLGLGEKTAAEETIRLTNGEFPPLSSEEMPHYGFGSRIVSEAFALSGVRVEYGFFEWKRSLDQARAGRWDGSIIWARTPDRERDFYYSDPIMMDTNVFFHIKTYPFDWSSIDDLKDIPIGATTAYNYGEDFQKAERDGVIHVQRAPKDELNFRKLLKGKIKIFPQNLHVGRFMIRKHFKPEQVELITYHPTPLLRRTYHVLLSRRVERNKHMLALFNKGLKRLREMNRIEEFAIEYNIEREMLQ